MKNGFRYSEELGQLQSRFDRAARIFCESSGGLGCEISPFFKGDNLPENLRLKIARIFFNSYIIVFRYTARGLSKNALSILDCSVCFWKSEQELQIPLPFILDFCESDAAEPICFPYISSEAAMAEAFEILGNVLMRLKGELSDISGDEARKQAIIDYLQEEYNSFGITGEVGILTDEIFCLWLSERFSSKAYILALKGKYGKAAAALEKYKRKCRYEKRLLGLWKQGKNFDPGRLTEILQDPVRNAERGALATDYKELLSMLLSWLLLILPITAVFLGIYFLIVLCRQHLTVYNAGPFANYPCCFICGFATAIMPGYFTRGLVYRLIAKKDYKGFHQRTVITSSPGVERFMEIFSVIIATASLVLIILMANYNVNFKRDGFVDNTEFLSLSGTYYDYNEVECFRYVPNRINSEGVTLELPSYMLVLKNGIKIDLYGLDDIENYESILVNLMREHNILIETG